MVNKMLIIKLKEVHEQKFRYKKKEYIFRPYIKYTVPEDFYSINKDLLIKCSPPKKKEKLNPLKKVPEKKIKPILIIGNGHSTKLLEEYGFHNIPRHIETFGMNSAYRYFSIMPWWPTYYASFDYKVSKHHMNDFISIVKNNKIPIVKFFTYESLVPQEYKKLKKFDLRNGTIVKDKQYASEYITTGVAAAKLAIEMGYNKIILIGVDCNYIDEIEGSKRIEGIKARDYVMTKTPKHNPNYFFDTYQQKGDIYRWPHKEWHIKSWEILAEQIKDKDIEIVNCSDISEVKCFPFSTLEKELGRTNKKLVTFCMALKGRSAHALKSIKSLVNKCSVEMGLFNFIIVEDESNDMLNLSRFKYKDNVKHQVIKTSDFWNKSKLLNHAFKQVKTPYIMTWDADFLAGKSFFGEILKWIYKLNVNEYYLAIACTETGKMERKKINVVFNKHDFYGAGYLFRTDQARVLHGYDEKFVGYGWEEHDFNKRLQLHFNLREKRIWVKKLLYHMSHDESWSGSKENYEKNRLMLCKHKKGNENIVNLDDSGWEKTNE